MVDLSVKIGNLHLKNPVLMASGTFGYGTEYRDYFDVSLLGGIITKTVTGKMREGNPMPRIVETPCGMLNSIGLANVGVDRFCQEKMPELDHLDTVVIVNVAGSTIEEYSEVVEKMQGYDRVDGFEINISCPNVKKGGLEFGTDPEITETVVSGVRKATDKTILVKLTPNVTDIVTIARASVNGGADGLSLINTVLGMGVDIETRKPHLARIVGGLSGPAIKPIALAKVYQVVKAISIPVIGIGGIMKWEDAVAFFIVGATAIQVGTLNFIEPDGAVKIIQGIERYCEKNGMRSIGELTGSLQKG
ncbi:dihydroorotate dehydrogenase [bacterium]|nr:dihydroorotate dehydrogenase [bacterium]RQV95980.1 MAG: dihydroorotate dehydrogenase [bacterium]